MAHIVVSDTELNVAEPLQDGRPLEPSPKKSRKGAHYSGGLEPMVQAYEKLLPWLSGYSVESGDPIDEDEFTKRLPWLEATAAEIHSHLLVCYSSWYELGMAFAKSGKLPVQSKRPHLAPRLKEVRAAATEFAIELKTLHFHAPSFKYMDGSIL